MAYVDTAEEWAGLPFDLPDDPQKLADLPMWVAIFQDDGWGMVDWKKVEGRLMTYGTAPRPEPGAGVFYYTPTLFEGLTLNPRRDGSGCLLRPDLNTARMNAGACYYGWPELPPDFMMSAYCAICVRAIQNGLLGPFGSGARVYLRPVYMQIGRGMGLSNLKRRFMVSILVLPAGVYFKKGGFRGADFVVSQTDVRAWPGGTGSIKTSASYGRHLYLLRLAKAAGFSEILYTDHRRHRYIKELGAASAFVIDQTGRIRTPPLEDGTILPGITRACVIGLARHLGYEVDDANEVPIGGMQDEFQAMFFTGTAAGLAPCANLTSVHSIEEMHRVGRDKATLGFRAFDNEGIHPVVEELYHAYQRLISGEDDPFDWTVPVVP